MLATMQRRTVNSTQPGRTFERRRQLHAAMQIESVERNRQRPLIHHFNLIMSLTTQTRRGKEIATMAAVRHRNSRLACCTERQPRTT